MATDVTEKREELFVTPPTGRNIHTQVKGMRRLVDEPVAAASQPAVRYGYRSFDRQWTFADPRLMALDRPAFWQARSNKQFFLATMRTNVLGAGPAMTATSNIPDLHYFCNRGGKDIIPLYRDRAAKNPNVTAGLLELLSQVLQLPVAPEDLAAYVYAILGHPAYQETFSEGLGTPGPRVPITASVELWKEAVATGQDLLWAHTFGERFTSLERPGGNVPRLDDVYWTKVPSTIPDTKQDVEHDPTTATLAVGDGTLTGVTSEVWEYSVSGFPVVKQWFGQRTAKGIGRAASSRATPLDRIRPSCWESEWTTEALELITILRRTVDHQAGQKDLLARILENKLVNATDLPKPTKEQQDPPETGSPWYIEQDLPVGLF